MLQTSLFELFSSEQINPAIEALREARGHLHPIDLLVWIACRPELWDHPVVAQQAEDTLRDQCSVSNPAAYRGLSLMDLKISRLCNARADARSGVYVASHKPGWVGLYSAQGQPLVRWCPSEGVLSLSRGKIGELQRGDSSQNPIALGLARVSYLCNEAWVRPCLEHYRRQGTPAGRRRVQDVEALRDLLRDLEAQAQ